MDAQRGFEELIAEGEAVPVEGWDFSWFGEATGPGGRIRATEERPSWGYAQLVAERIADATGAVTPTHDRTAPAHPVDSVLDLQTGGGEVFAVSLAAAGRAGRIPRTVWATEGWAPNLALARERLELFRGEVVQVSPDAPLPFAEGRFDLVTSRHPVRTDWPEVARVLRPGGAFLSQQVAAGSNRGLYEFLMGPQPLGENHERSLESLVRGAQAAGLRVVEALHESTRVEFFDIGAVVHFLRKVLWTVPGFTVERYRDRLLALHERILADGSFVCHSERALIEARRA
ncbi:class I SAM-dependent methyltransferase [Herbiconiux sp. 11R-BC]|uniref:class I SAM-dependent methyltransferase n=1 Tax=Herbiconiux sp. 11R-BC TaxID=3111637 RepID=UPI003C0D725D